VKGVYIYPLCFIYFLTTQPVFSILFSDTFNCYSFLGVENEISHPYQNEDPTAYLLIDVRENGDTQLTEDFQIVLHLLCVFFLFPVLNFTLAP
jgi:hypothetical protein